MIGLSNGHVERTGSTPPVNHKARRANPRPHLRNLGTRYIEGRKTRVGDRLKKKRYDSLCDSQSSHHMWRCVFHFFCWVCVQSFLSQNPQVAVALSQKFKVSILYAKHWWISVFITPWDQGWLISPSPSPSLPPIDPRTSTPTVSQCQDFVEFSIFLSVFPSFFLCFATGQSTWPKTFLPSIKLDVWRMNVDAKLGLLLFLLNAPREKKIYRFPLLPLPPD